MHQLEAIPERVVGVYAVVSVERLVVGHAVPSTGNSLGKTTRVINDEGRMRLRGRPERGIDAEMHPQVTVLEPAPAAGREMRWLLHMRDAEEALVEGNRLPFFPRWHSQLNVIQSQHSHEHIMASREETALP